MKRTTINAEHAEHAEPIRFLFHSAGSASSALYVVVEMTMCLADHYSLEHVIFSNTRVGR
ncbi:MAG: hypothetical protein DMF98_06900 [Acidobacteria bacterium]|nr:MAG: hypothetical protein DMF98_06900 [Acidobacteriota bacterium]